MAQNTFRDSIDVLQYIIHLDLSKTQTKQIWGMTEIKLKPVYELSHVKLDLEGLQTDSVFSNGKKIKFLSDEKLLSIFPEIKLKASDTFQISVFYHGKPLQDQQWGGFFIDKNYAFNYGVGMAAAPPNYGRVWYPCIDNFTDRAFYEYFIKTKANHLAACPGLLESYGMLGDGTQIFHWKLNQCIPTYLSSVAVADYEVIKDTVQGIERVIPIEIYVERGNVEKAKKTFANVQKFIHAFEYRFGPYKWDKVGYVSTRFNSGAMEHATNIAYPAYCNGITSCEKTLVHELSHHWFGDLVTCASEKDMWLNEGWASFCEAIYYEYVGGSQAYKDYVRDNHKAVLIYALNNPNAFGSLYGMPHSDTYGSVVYDKGADIARCLRGQIGDDLFFTTLKKYFRDYAFQSISVDQFKDYLSKETGLDLNDFFNFWVKSPGFPDFSINNLKIKKRNDKFQVNFNLNQRLIYSDKYLNSSIVEFGILDKSLKLHNYKLKQQGRTCPQILELDFEPALFILDPDEKIADATTQEYFLMDRPELYGFETANMVAKVTALGSPVYFHCVQHWIAPEKEKLPKNFKVVYDKFWQIDYYGASNFEANVNFKIYSNSTFYFSENNKTKLKILYRENSDNQWKVIENPGNFNINQNKFEVQKIKNGQYTIGLAD